MTLHLTIFDGATSATFPISALSDFRARQLLPALQAIDHKIVGISARFVHLVATPAEPSDSVKTQLAALLSYGEPCRETLGKKLEEAVFIVSPAWARCRPGLQRRLTLPELAAWLSGVLSASPNTALH